MYSSYSTISIAEPVLFPRQEGPCMCWHKCNEANANRFSSARKIIFRCIGFFLRFYFSRRFRALLAVAFSPVFLCFCYVSLPIFPSLHLGYSPAFMYCIWLRSTFVLFQFWLALRLFSFHETIAFFFVFVCWWWLSDITVSRVHSHVKPAVHYAVTRLDHGEQNAERSVCQRYLWPRKLRTLDDDIEARLLWQQLLRQSARARSET